MKLILGDNQFFGINHANINKGVETQSFFDSTHKISSFIRGALACGLEGFMINSNEIGFRVVEEFDFAQQDTECHYSVPYPHKYAGVVNDSGIIALVYLILRQLRISDIARAVRFLFTLNAVHLMPVILRLEIPKSLPHGSVVYLQNVVTDLIMGLRNGDKLLAAYVRNIQQLGFIPGLITMNLGSLNASLRKELSKEDLVICFNINKDGFNVFPTTNAVEKQILEIKETTNWRLMGMSVFSSGSGRVPISESIAYIKNLPLDYVVFGSSKLVNIKSNRDSFHESR